jgi:CheY-like chemotaxis protein
MNSYFLYAEDDQDDIDLLQDFMNNRVMPNKLIAVNNGYLLLQHLQQIQSGQSYPCLIILDAKLPSLNGLETLELLKTDDMYRLIPVIIFSSKLSDAERHVCQQLGAEIIEKPADYANWPVVMDKFYSYVDEV